MFSFCFEKSSMRNYMIVIHLKAYMIKFELVKMSSLNCLHKFS